MDGKTFNRIFDGGRIMTMSPIGEEREVTEMKERLWVTVYGYEAGQSEERQQFTTDLEKENSVRFLGQLVQAIATGEPVEEKGGNPFVGWRPLEIIVTNESGKKTEVDLNYERASRMVEGTPYDFTNAILNEKGEITGWKS